MKSNVIVCKKLKSKYFRRQVKVALRRGEKIVNNYLVITGGSRGIGEKTITTFAQNGWKILNLSRSNSKLPNVKNINVDLTQADAVLAAAPLIKAEVKGADQIALVHNAALLKSNHVATLDAKELREDLEI